MIVLKSYQNHCSIMKIKIQLGQGDINFLEFEIELRQEILKEHGSVPKYLHEKFAAAVLGLLSE